MLRLLVQSSRPADKRGVPPVAESDKPPHRDSFVASLLLAFFRNEGGSGNRSPLRRDSNGHYVPCLCDCGNLYCPGDCPQEARRESVRRAGARYQRTLRGARRHAERQRRYRQRRKREVTHHGFSLVTSRCSVSRHLVSASEPIDVDVKEPPRPPVRLLQTRCAFCGRRLPPFARLHPWRWSG